MSQRDLCQRVGSVFTVYKPWIRDTIKPHMDYVTEDLHSSESITDQEKKDLDLEVENPDKASKLMEIVESRIKERPHYLGDFLSVLLSIEEVGGSLGRIHEEYESSLHASRRASTSSNASQSSPISETHLSEDFGEDFGYENSRYDLQPSWGDRPTIKPLLSQVSVTDDDTPTPTPKLERANQFSPIQSKSLVLPETRMQDFDERIAEQNWPLGRSHNSIYHSRQASDEMDVYIHNIQKLVTKMTQEFTTELVTRVRHQCAYTQQALKNEIKTLEYQHAIEAQNRESQLDTQLRASESRELALQAETVIHQDRERALEKQLEDHKREVKILQGEAEALQKRLDEKVAQLADKERQMYVLQTFLGKEQDDEGIGDLKKTKYEKQLQAVEEIDKELEGLLQNKTKEEKIQIQQRITRKLSEVRRPHTVASLRHSSSSSSENSENA